MPTLPALALLPLALSATAGAQDAVRLEIVREGVVGGASPALTVHPRVDLERLDLQLSCGATRAGHQGPAELAVPVVVPLPVPQGRHACTGRLAVRMTDGSEGEMPLSFQVEVLPELRLSTAPDHLDLQAGTLVVEGSRPLASAEAILTGEQGELGRAERTSPAGDGLTLHWSPPSAEILQIQVTAQDAHGFAARLDLFPWSYSVPHEDVVFETGSATIRPEEEGKLEDAWARLQEVIGRYGKVAPVHLYVAGYTDTVGSAASNRTLSEARARAIAAWFRARGFTGPTWYQGLGEQGQAVPTPDETDEAANRRVDYIVAAQAPPKSERLPTSTWTPLR
ncbi:OmpA family protein [Myxococcota bacterium]|nr:OmpA family protein [Myxococcota bacterium]